MAVADPLTGDREGAMGTWEEKRREELGRGTEQQEERREVVEELIHLTRPKGQERKRRCEGRSLSARESSAIQA